MKLKIYLIFSILLFTLLYPVPIKASTNTFTRTNSNFLVPEDIVVTSSNMSDILTTPAVDASEKVYDFADLLTDDEEKKIYRQAVQFIKSTDFDLGIVTVDSYDKLCPYEDCSRVYADDFYDYNDFGMDEEKSGLLFLVDMKNREIYISTSGKAIDMYDSNRIDKILEAIYSEFSDENYYEGITKFMTIIENYDTMGLPSNKDNKYSIDSSGEIYRVFPWKIIFGIPSIITIIVMAILIHKNKIVRKATSSREYLDKDSVNIKVLSDVLTSSYTMSTPIYHSSGSGGGHSGSSGRSHGGGGRHF